MGTNDLAAERSEIELLRALVAKIPAVLAYWDSTLRCRLASPAIEGWLGISSCECFIGKHISEVLGRLYELNRPYIEGALRGEAQEFEREVANPSGGPPRHGLVHYVPDIVEGVVRGFFVLVTDVSEMKRAQLAFKESEARFSELLAHERQARECAEAATEQLRQSEERFRLTVDEAPIGMALVALDGRFVRVNRVLCEIVGYAADELTKLTFQEITHPEDLDTDVALARRLARGEIPRCQFAKRYIRKNGTIVDVMLSSSVIQDRDGAPLYYISQIEDVTERKRLEDKLRLSEAKSSGILSISADAIISVDDLGRITMFNEAAERAFGYSSSEVIGVPLEILMPERFRATHHRHLEDFTAETAPARRMGKGGVAVIGLRKNGEEFPADGTISKLDVGGRRVLTVALRDVTEQKRVEMEQRFLAEIGPALAGTLAFEETASTLAELAVRDLADVCVVEVVEDGEESRRIEVACRDSSQAWLCKRLAQIPCNRRDPELLRSVIETGRPVLLPRPSEETIALLARSDEQRRATGAAQIRAVVAVPLLGHARLLGGLALVSTTPSRTYGAADVRLVEELARRAAVSIENARLYSAARRAAQVRDEVMGVVAHDLRNPLNSIVINASSLRRRKAEPERRSQRPGEAIARAASRMDRLIEDLLDVTRMEAGRPSVEPVRVSAEQLVSDAVLAQRSLATPASLELRLDVATDLPDIWGDRDRLLQVFENLIGNSLKFTDPGGRISVGAELRGEEVVFWVSDTGRGIAAEDLPHLFDRFWQARKARRRGAGLGLPIVKGVVEAHRGRIWVESTLGKGTTFFFTIPAAPWAEVWRREPAPRSA